MSSTKIKSTIKSVRLTTKGTSGPNLTAATATATAPAPAYVPVLGDTLRITYKSQYPESRFGFEGLRNAVIILYSRTHPSSRFPPIAFMNSEGKFVARDDYHWCSLQRTENFGIRCPIDQWDVVSFEKI